MATITIEELTPGMRLADDLHGSNGRFLLPKGIEIEEKHIRILKIWGVAEATVENMDSNHSRAGDAPAVSAHIFQQAQLLVNELFILSNDHFAPMRECKRYSLRKTVDLLSRGRNLDKYLPNAHESAAACFCVPHEQPASALVLADTEVQLASFPDIYFQIIEVLNNPSSTAAHVADVVSKDSSLSVKLLKLVNSPFYGFPSKVDSITRAVALVGCNELSMLALGVSVMQYFNNVPPELMDMRTFWMHSIACATFAHILAGHVGRDSEERFFLGGLIHDIGRLVILKNASDCAALSLRLASGKPCLLYEAEEQIMGFDHAAVAGHLLQQWQFPDSLEEMVAFHHAPCEADERIDAAIIHLADIMTRSIWSSYKGLFHVPPLDEEAWGALGLNPGVVPLILKQGEHLILDVINTFLGEP